MYRKEAILTQQAKRERLNPVLPKLKTILEGLSIEAWISLFL